MDNNNTELKVPPNSDDDNEEREESKHSISSNDNDDPSVKCEQLEDSKNNAEEISQYTQEEFGNINNPNISADEKNVNSDYEINFSDNNEQDVESKHPSVTENSNYQREEPINTANSLNNSEEENFQSSYKPEYETESEIESYGVIDSPISLQRKLERVNNEIIQQDNNLKYLNKEISKYLNILGTVTDHLQEYTYKQNKISIEQEISVVSKKLDDLENKRAFIRAKLDQHESIKRKSFSRQTESVEIIEKAETISPQSLFLEDNPLENIILYAATFFPNLSSYDFERVVSFLLEGQSTIINVKSRQTTEKGEFQYIEESQEESLVEMWKNSFIYPDRFLSSCFISSVTLKDDSHVIDFISPKLRERFKNYFQEQQPLYLLEQFKRAKFLLFDQEEQVAINSMSLSVDMAISSPNIYGKEWLFEIVTRWASKVNQNTITEFSSEQSINRFIEQIKPEKKRWSFVVGRISSLIMRMLDSNKLKDSVVSVFFNNLIAKNLNNESDHDTALAIVKRLFSYPEFNGFYWLKQLLDRGEVDIKNNTYIFLYRKLNQNNLDSDNFDTYSFLDIVKSWLPEHGLSADRFSPSNKYALQLIPDYCDQSIKELDLKQYGKLPPHYSLFTPLFISDSTNNSDSIKEQLNILFAWLLHPEITSAVKAYLDNDKGINRKQIEGKKVLNPSKDHLISKLLDAEDISVADSFVPLVLAEWCIILWGLDKQEPEPKAIELINTLIHQVIIYTKITHQEYFQKKLVECWSLLTEFFLDQAESYRESGNRQLRKQYLRRRNIVKYLKKQFKASKKQIVIS